MYDEKLVASLVEFGFSKLVAEDLFYLLCALKLSPEEYVILEENPRFALTYNSVTGETTIML
jgi:hypothetical protein